MGRITLNIPQQLLATFPLTSLMDQTTDMCAELRRHYIQSDCFKDHGSGKACIAKLKQTWPDLFLTDVPADARIQGLLMSDTNTVTGIVNQKGDRMKLATPIYIHDALPDYPGVPPAPPVFGGVPPAPPLHTGVPPAPLLPVTVSKMAQVDKLPVYMPNSAEVHVIREGYLGQITDGKVHLKHVENTSKQKQPHDSLLDAVKQGFKLKPMSEDRCKKERPGMIWINGQCIHTKTENVSKEATKELTLLDQLHLGIKLNKTVVTKEECEANGQMYSEKTKRCVAKPEPAKGMASVYSALKRRRQRIDDDGSDSDDNDNDVKFTDAEWA